MKYILIFLVKTYKKIISPIKPPCCRFSPTCSAYAVEALKVHGAVRGSYLSIKRILRCNPFCKGGADPVPPKISYKKNCKKG
ncbi:MAG: membrane protein insertion efficiency factor YidD [Clostridia bacterium]|nr:membrane protein insertion efficiency factor YidD [Clostridia bacterium]